MYIYSICTEISYISASLYECILTIFANETFAAFVSDRATVVWIARRQRLLTSFQVLTIATPTLRKVKSS